MRIAGRISFVVCAATLILHGQETAERVDAWRNGLAPGMVLAPWRMAWSEEPGGSEPGGTFLQFNADCKAEPWAGFTLRRETGTALVVSSDWLETGFIRFLFTIGRDRYGNPGGGVPLQVRPEAQDIEYQHVQSRFIDAGRGGDEDPDTWQEVLIPLSYWTNLQPGAEIRGLSIQCVERPERDFACDEIGFMRFEEVPAAFRPRDTAAIAQPWVTWPAYDALPTALQADRDPPRFRGGAYVNGSGQRVFLLNPYCREDHRLDLWGTRDTNSRAPDHGLFDSSKHGWIYAELPSREGLCRLGFNSYSATVPPGPWWKTVGYAGDAREEDAAELETYAAALGLPFYVDTVCWPWTLGRPAAEPGKTTLPATAFTAGANHWTPYRITGEGRQVWLDMWRFQARRYREAGVPVIGFELLNEPAYRGTGEDHAREFREWLERRYGTADRMNAVWQSDFATVADAADVAEKAPDAPDGRALDYDEYLAERFAGLVAEGVTAVRTLLPDAPVGVQTMGGYVLAPREAVWKHRFIDSETLVLTPTGGGRWTGGGRARGPGTDLLSHPIAPAPLENDLLLGLAGDKMIVDNETYLRGETAMDVRNRLWEQVLAGLDGLTVFSWSRRGWAWWQTVADVQTEADKFPYSVLNPIARRTESLRGIHDFAAEVQALAPEILPKPWGPSPTVGVLYSWPHARRRALDRKLPNKTEEYYAALKYTHRNLAVLASDRVCRDGVPSGIRVLVAGGIRYAEPELIPRLEAFVRAGGVLLVGEETLSHDVYGRDLATGDLLGVTVPATAVPTEPGATVCGVPLRNGVRHPLPMPGTRVALRDSAGRAVATERLIGKGRICYQGADVTGYALARLLEEVLFPKGDIPPEMTLAEITDAETGKRAPNILLSRRDHGDRTALLLMNLDRYPKTVRIRIPGRQSPGLVRDGLDRVPVPVGGDSFPRLEGDAILAEIGPGEPAVFLIGNR